MSNGGVYSEKIFAQVLIWALSLVRYKLINPLFCLINIVGNRRSNATMKEAASEKHRKMQELVRKNNRGDIIQS